MAEIDSEDSNEQPYKDSFFSKSAALLSALFVLRKFLFNNQRYKTKMDVIENESENLKTYISELKQYYRLFFLDNLNETESSEFLEKYILQIHLHEVLYKIHHTLLSQMPTELESYITDIDSLLHVFNSESNNLVFSDTLIYRQKLERLIIWLETITT